MQYKEEDLKQVLENVRISTLLYVTKNGKVYSPEAEHFLDWVNTYSAYCFPKEKENWEKVIRSIIYSNFVLEPENHRDIISLIVAYIDAGRVMECYVKTNSWESVIDLIKERATWGGSFAWLTKVLLKFSPIGVDFVDKLEPWMVSKSKIKQEYEKAKTNQNKRNLIQKLVNTLSTNCEDVLFEDKSTSGNVQPVKLFSEEKLDLLRKQNDSENKQDEEMGYITHKKQCDLSNYQVSRERTQELFEDIVLK